jgi:hypothetical protein
VSAKSQNAIENVIDYAKQSQPLTSRLIRVYDAAGNVIETHEHTGDFKDW